VKGGVAFVVLDVDVPLVIFCEEGEQVEVRVRGCGMERCIAG